MLQFLLAFLFSKLVSLNGHYSEKQKGPETRNQSLFNLPIMFRGISSL